MHTLYYYNLTGLLSLQLLQQIAFPVYVPFYKDITNTPSLNLATRLMYFSDENPSHTKRLKFGSLLILVQILAKYPQTILTLLYKKGKKLVQMAPGYFILLYRRQKLIYYLSFRYHKHKHVTVNRLNFKVICILRGKNDDLYSPLRTPTHHQY